MKTILSILLIINLGLSLNAQSDKMSERISISFDEVSLSEALNKLEKVANIHFAYNSLPIYKDIISVSFENTRVDSIIDSLLSPRGLNYSSIASNVTIFYSKRKKLSSQNNTKESNYSISGYVYDKETGESLIGCNLYVSSLEKGTTTNNYGFYSLQLPDGEHVLSISYLGYEELFATVNKEGKLNFKLLPNSNQLQEVTITADHETTKEIVRNKTIGTMKLKAKEITSIPSVGGEVDVLKAITLLPGVKQGVDGNAGFYVRGGGPDQNLILLDNVPMYNPYHLWGFLSTFNAEAVNNMEITKGAFPARYGGRLSSVLDITMKEGNNQEWEKDLSIGLLSMKAAISGPIVKDKSSIMLAIRRTYADLIIIPILKIQNSNKASKVSQGYNFSDINLKYNSKLSDKDRIFFSGFYSRDKFYYETKAKKGKEQNFNDNYGFSQGWGNKIASVRWNHQFSNKLFLNTTSYYSRYNFYDRSFSQSGEKNDSTAIFFDTKVQYNSLIEDIAIKQDYQYYPNNNHTIRFGTGIVRHHFKPGVSIYKAESDKETIDRQIEHNDIIAFNGTVYFEDKVTISKRLKIDLGVHGSGFSVEGKQYFSIEPRLGMRYMINDAVSIKMGYAKMTQYLHLLTSSGITQSSDLWVPSTSKIKPQESQQVSIGTAWSMGSNYVLEIESYYKKMKNLIDYRDGASFLHTATGWENKVAIGKGTSYGVELYVKKKYGKLTGWLGYTWSKTDRTFEQINFGKTYPYTYDRRHDISIVGSYKLAPRWTINSSWVFFTGNAVTLPLTAYVTPNYDGNYHNGVNFPSPGLNQGSEIGSTGIIDNSIERNNYRLPSYHRLDITATKTIKKVKTEQSFTFGLTNAYNRFNSSFYRVSHEQDTNTGKSIIKYTSNTLFPIMPTINYKISF